MDSPVSTHDTTKLEVGFHGKDDKKFSPKLSTKSFRKVAKIVKWSGGSRKSQKLEETRSEEMEVTDRGTESSNEQSASPSFSQVVAEVCGDSSGPERPSNIAFRQSSTTESMTASSASSTVETGSTPHIQRSSSSSSDDFVQISLPPKITPDGSSQVGLMSSKTSQVQMTPTLPRLSETRECPKSTLPSFSTPTHTKAIEGEEEFFSINEMHLCMCGQWLCVSNAGGVAMAFEFQLKNKKVPNVRI